MYYADDILVLENGLRILPKALHPIGITNNSECWGIEIVPAPDKPPKPPHLLLSAFHPDKWHILFRVVVELRDEVGALARTSRIIGDLGFNIVSTQCAPSGHNHATWHIIVEAESEKACINNALAESIVLFEPNHSAFHSENLKFRQDLTERFTVPLLRHSKKLEQGITQADENFDEEKKILHKRFRKGDTLLYTENIEQFFDITREDEQSLFTRISEQELNRAVESKWLQQMAVFRCYSQASQKRGGSSANRASWNNPISFKYDSKDSILKPITEEDSERYLHVIKSCARRVHLPLKAIAAYNSEEYYLRIVLPENETRERRVSIDLDYKASLDESSHPSSKGLLKEVAEILAGQDINMNYVSNATTVLTKHNEKGVLSLVGTLNGIDDKKDVIRNLDSSLKDIARRNQNFSFEKTTVGEVGAKVIFISTKFEFFDQRETFQREIESVCKKHGFIPAWGDPQYNSDRSEAKLKDLSDYIIRRIQESHAFLQVIPKTPKKQSWLLFELGIACGFNIPSAICVDGKKVREYPPEVAPGWAKYPFNSDKETTSIVSEIEHAIQCLSAQVYNR